eukprot:UN07828
MFCKGFDILIILLSVYRNTARLYSIFVNIYQIYQCCHFQYTFHFS